MGLGNPAKNDRLLGQDGAHGDMSALIGQLGVDLITEHEEAVFARHLGQSFQILAGIGHAGGIGWIVEH